MIKRKGIAMQVIIKNKTTFDCVQLNQVSNIAYDSSTKIYTITNNGTNYTYSSDNYLICVFII